MISQAVQQAGLGKVIDADDAGDKPLLRVHDAAYLDFLRDIYRDWHEVHPEDQDILPHAWCIRRMSQRPPQSIYGRVGYYSFDAGTPITSGTWVAARSSAQAALTARRLIQQQGEPAVFALTRQPGHHAGRDFFGGYCFLNNAAIAAQAFLDGGADRVAILDVDYHHGNGTQDIFYDRDDVLVISIHADPRHEYPWFLSHRDERGDGIGLGYNLNFPLPSQTGWSCYRPTLQAALDAVQASSVDYLVISLGVDTWQGDPLSSFQIQSQNFYEIGEMLEGLGLPTLFVMEGGYAVQQLGQHVVNVLQGFREAQGGQS
jgi:acetoin utilization deacetylase AcuC-like enzyme